MFQIRITDAAESDIQNIFEWWRDHRSPEQAARWYESIFPAITTLEQMPNRCSIAREDDLYEGELRQLHFGVGRRPTHRIVFAVEEDVVVVLRVLHHALDD